MQPADTSSAANHELRRRRHFSGGDLVAAALIGLFLTVGGLVHHAVLSFAYLGHQLISVGTSFKLSSSSAAAAVGGIPIIGDAADAGMDGVSDVGVALAAAGAREVAMAHDAARLGFLLTACVPAAIVLLIRGWQRQRTNRVAREALQVLALPQGSSLLALRALVRADPQTLRQLGEAPLDAVVTSDSAVQRHLVDVALRDAGWVRSERNLSRRSRSRGSTPPP